MSTIPEDVRVELELNGKHVIKLVNIIRFHCRFGFKFFSSAMLTKLINKYFDLQHFDIVLDHRQLISTLSKNHVFQHLLKRNLRTLCTDDIYTNDYMVASDGGKYTKMQYYMFLPSSKKCKTRAPGRIGTRSAGRNSHAITLPNIVNGYMWQIDEEANKFIDELSCTMSLITALGINDAEELVCRSPRRDETSSNLTPAFSTPKRGQGAGRPRTVPTIAVATPSPNRSERLLFHNPSLLPYVAIRPIWDSQTARNLFNMPDKKGVEMRSDIRTLAESLVMAGSPVARSFEALLIFLPSNAQIGDIFEMKDELKATLQCKCLMLGSLYLIALDEYGWSSRQIGIFGGESGINWRDCCIRTVEKVNGILSTKIKPRQLELWNKTFRIEKRVLLTLPPDKNLSPPFLVNNPVEAQLIAKYMRTQLDSFHINDMRTYILDTLLVNMAKHSLLVKKGIVAEPNCDTESVYFQIERDINQHKGDLLDEEVDAEVIDIKRQHRLTSIAESTIYRWLKYLGFKNKEHQKSFRCDGHEAPDTVVDRVQFIEKYLRDERQGFRWVQVKESELKALELENLIPFGTEVVPNRFSTVQPADSTYEFHIFLEEKLQQFVKTKVFGGDLSFRMLPCLRPIIFIGQDESSFEQHLYTSRTWVDKDGKSANRQKGSGYGVMVSAFISSSLGLGLGISNENLEMINKFRETNESHKHYVSESSAHLLGLDTRKELSKLEGDPSVEFFDYGKNNEGWWRSENVAIQLENLCDCLAVMYPCIKFVFQFDYSSNHAKSQDNGLKASNLGMDYGGKQTRIRDSLITEGSVGDQPDRTVNVGDMYSHQYILNSSKPLHMLSMEQDYHENEDQPCRYEWKTRTQIYNIFQKTSIQCLIDIPKDAPSETFRYWALKHDVKASKNRVACKIKEKEVSLKDDDLRVLLSSESHATTGTSKMLRRRCEAFGLPTTKHETTGLHPRWMGVPKGLKQICVERGLVSLEKTLTNKYYSMKGKHINGEAVDLGTSYVHILAQTNDFKSEVSLLGKVVERYGYVIWFTPKYHCELAGEGIEYMWGFVKWIYRKIPKGEKDTKYRFIESVEKLLTRETVKRERVARFSRRARRYICAYYVQHYGEGESTAVEIVKDVNLDLVEKMAKTFKTHRAALDFDLKFIKKEARSD